MRPWLFLALRVGEVAIIEPELISDDVFSSAIWKEFMHYYKHYFLRGILWEDLLRFFSVALSVQVSLC